MRLLLVTVIAAALMLTVRLASLWDGVPGGLGASPAAAADAEPAKPAAAAEPAREGAAAAEPAKPAAAAKPAMDGADAAPGAADPAQTDRAKPPAIAEDEWSDAELATLQDLAARRDQLDAREKALDTRSGMLAAGEKRVDEKISELKELQATLQNLLKTYDEQETAKLKSLVKIYENMKPKDAAPIFEQLDIDTLLDIVERMKEAKVALVLAKMNPAKAKEVTDELARRHQISEAVGQGGT